MQQPSSPRTTSRPRPVRHSVWLGAVASFALALGLLMAPPAGQAQSCLSRAEASQLIASGQVIQLAQVNAIVSQAGFGQLLSADLCQSGGGFVWRVLASNASGASAQLTINAVSGAIQ